MSDSTEETPSLLNFFIFDTLHNFPEDEVRLSIKFGLNVHDDCFFTQEYKSIIYYHPPDTSQDIQLKETGKTAAILKFSQYFIVMFYILGSI